MLTYYQWTLRNKFQWKCNPNTWVFILENAFEDVVLRNGDRFVQGTMSYPRGARLKVLAAKMRLKNRLTLAYLTQAVRTTIPDVFDMWNILPWNISEAFSCMSKHYSDPEICPVMNTCLLHTNAYQTAIKGYTPMIHGLYMFCTNIYVCSSSRLQVPVLYNHEGYILASLCLQLA